MPQSERWRDEGTGYARDVRITGFWVSPLLQRGFTSDRQGVPSIVLALVLDSRGRRRRRVRSQNLTHSILTCPYSRGTLSPVTLAGSELEINYRASAPGFVQVRIQDPVGTPFPGHTLADCPEIIGDEAARIVRWRGDADVGKLAGQPVRLRFVMKDADLFALRFQ